MKNFSSQISDIDIEDSLYYEYRKFGEVSVKVSVDNRGERVAHAIFRSSESASGAKNAKGHLVMYDRRLTVEAVYDRKEKRARSPSPLASDHRDRDSNYRKRSLSPPNFDDPISPRRHSPSTNSDDRSRPPNSPDDPDSEPNVPPEDDPGATRTLFVGNLESDITNNEIRRCLEMYGRVEDVDIKRGQRGGAAYAFVRFSNLDMAYKAKVAMQGKPIVKFPTRIGYGKVFHTSKLWIGGLGSWTSLSVLEREFDRFGAIRKIDYEKGTSFAYILYESIDAARAACSQMRGCTLPGSDTRLRVDFADPDPGMPGYDEWSDRKRNDHDHYNNRGGHRERRYYDRKDDRDRNDRFRRDRPKSGERQNIDRGNIRSYEPNERGVDNERRSPGRYNKNGRQPSPPRGPIVVADSLAKGKYEFKKKYAPPPVEDADVNFRRDQMKAASDLHELCHVLNPPCWDGALVLKKTAFSVRFFLMDGDVGIVNNLITSITQEGVPTRLSLLNVTQRLRQEDDRLKDVNHRLRDENCKNCILLAVPGLPMPAKSDPEIVFTQQRHLRGLVKYFKEKNAAGVVSFHGVNPNLDDKKEKVTLGMLHAFPPGQFANDLLFSLAPSLNPHLLIEEYLVIVVARGSSAV